MHTKFFLPSQSNSPIFCKSRKSLDGKFLNDSSEILNSVSRLAMKNKKFSKKGSLQVICMPRVPAKKMQELEFLFLGNLWMLNPNITTIFLSHF
jgi:hypothetical protein